MQNVLPLLMNQTFSKMYQSNGDALNLKKFPKNLYLKKHPNFIWFRGYIFCLCSVCTAETTTAKWLLLPICAIDQEGYNPMLGQNLLL
jgi:hypothetical protein